MPPVTAAEYRKRREYEEVTCPSGDVFRICKPDLSIFIALAGELPIPALPDADNATLQAVSAEEEQRNKRYAEQMLVMGVVSPKLHNDLDATGQPLLHEETHNSLHLSELDRMDVMVLLRRISLKMGLNTEVAQQAQAFRADEERAVDSGASAGIPPAAV